MSETVNGGVGEAVRQIADLAQKAQSPQEIKTGDPNTLAYVVDGRIEELNREREDWNFRFGTVASLIDSIDGFPDSRVFVFEEGVSVQYTDFDRGFLKLDVSDRVSAVIEHRETYDHKAFLKWLRFDLVGAIDDGLAARFGRLNLTSQGSMTSEHRSGRSAMGKSVEAEVQDAADIPESIRFSFPLWVGLPYRVEFDIQVYVDASSGQIDVQFDGDQYNQQALGCRVALANQIREGTGVKVYV